MSTSIRVYHRACPRAPATTPPTTVVDFRLGGLGLRDPRAARRVLMRFLCEDGGVTSRVLDRAGLLDALRRPGAHPCLELRADGVCVNRVNRVNHALPSGGFDGGGDGVDGAE